MRKVFITIIIMGFAVACSQHQKRQSPLQQWLPDPEKVIAVKDQIGLHAEQVKTIEDYYRHKKLAYDSIKRESDICTEQLRKLVAAHPVDEAAARERLQRLLSIETELKLIQFQVHVFVKNQLTPEQLDAFFNL